MALESSFTKTYSYINEVLKTKFTKSALESCFSYLNHNFDGPKIYFCIKAQTRLMFHRKLKRILHSKVYIIHYKRSFCVMPGRCNLCISKRKSQFCTNIGTLKLEKIHKQDTFLASELFFPSLSVDIFRPNIGSSF